MNDSVAFYDPFTQVRTRSFAPNQGRIRNRRHFKPSFTERRAILRMRGMQFTEFRKQSGRIHASVAHPPRRRKRDGDFNRRPGFCQANRNDRHRKSSRDTAGEVLQRDSDGIVTAVPVHCRASGRCWLRQLRSTDLSGCGDAEIGKTDQLQRNTSLLTGCSMSLPTEPSAF